MDYCSKPLTAQSQARAEQAKQTDTLFTLEGELLCECGEHVGARSTPWMYGPQGGPLAPTLHYPKKISRKPVNPSGKSGYYK
jgi:1,6-anhydro-N-acetylmuramate kinase